MQHVGDTKRLRWFSTGRFVISTETSHPRTLFVAFPMDCNEQPLPVVTALVSEFEGHTLDWLETAARFQRKGYAREAYEFLVGIYPQLKSSAGSVEGAAFMRAMGLDVGVVWEMLERIKK